MEALRIFLPLVCNWIVCVEMSTGKWGVIGQFLVLGSQFPVLSSRELIAALKLDVASK